MTTILELRELINKLHKNKIEGIGDAVYNHIFDGYTLNNIEIKLSNNKVIIKKTV